MSDCVGYDCRFGCASRRLRHFPTFDIARRHTAAAAARRRRPSRAARRRRRRRSRTRWSRRLRRAAPSPTSSWSSRAVSCAERHHPVYGGRSLPCFPGGTVALWLKFCHLFSPVYISNVHYSYRPPASTRARSALTSSPARRTASSISAPLTGAPRDSSASTAASSLSLIHI